MTLNKDPHFPPELLFPHSVPRLSFCYQDKVWSICLKICTHRSSVIKLVTNFATPQERGVNRTPITGRQTIDCVQDMDTKDMDKDSSYYMALYGLVSFMIVMLLIFLLYVACSKKYRLNWFEKNLLEAAETAELAHSSIVYCESSTLDHAATEAKCIHSVNPPPSRASSEPEDLRGSLQMTLSYDPPAGILTIRLIEAHDLQARDFSGTADPYAKIRLLPDRTNIWQTRIHKRTLNPVFDEDFVFEVRPATLGRRVLEVILYDFDAYSRHHSIGGVKLPLAHIDLSEKVTLWKGLGPCSEQDAKAELGDLMVSLAFLPSAERLTVVILKARNLRVVDDTRTSSDPFVKVSLLQGGKRIKKKKTGVHRNTLNPVFNEALTFDVSRDTLNRGTLEFCVMHDSLLGPSELLGRALVGPGRDCRPEERYFFNEVLTSKTATAQWLSLYEPQ
uniref:C2 domain-containing protein n=1 Tax=Timema monikensis TaxID=170555 RepID=A0A7R9HIW1_9NEOP|nr:unnamed protein product [Timema monikensis]